MSEASVLDRRQTIALLAGAVAAGPVAAIADEDFNPPIWMVRKGNSKVYLFGEMFAGTDFGSSPKVLEAFNESTEFWKETPPINRQEFQAVVDQAGKSETPLQERLTPVDARRLASAAAAMNIPLETLQPYRPWVVALQRLQGPVYQSLGVRVQQDAGVSDAAKTRNIQARTEFPDSRAALEFFARMPAAVEKEYLLSMLQTFEAGKASWDKRPKAWAVGDLSLEEAVVAQQAKDFPAYFPYVTTARNKAWVPRIEAMLDRNPSSFVRVGLHHLIGTESIQRYLAQSGLKSVRI